MRILLKPFYGNSFKNNAVFEINNGDNVFYKFKEKLKQRDIEIDTFDLIRGDENWAVFCDVPYPWEMNEWIYLLTHRERCILFCFESPIINPLSHIGFIQKLFKKVYTWSNGSFFLPVLDTNLNRKIVPWKDKSFMAMINANRSSFFGNELYSERVKALDFFKNIYLFGQGWKRRNNGLIPKNLDSKLDTLSKYKFCICYENCIAHGYISEKIIDCFKAHTVPIYYGAPNVTDYIPKDCFIDFRDFKDYQCLSKFLLDMNEKAYNGYIDRGAKYLKNNFEKYWSEEKFMTTFLEAISFEQ